MNERTNERTNEERKAERTQGHSFGIVEKITQRKLTPASMNLNSQFSPYYRIHTNSSNAIACNFYYQLVGQIIIVNRCTNGIHSLFFLPFFFFSDVFFLFSFFSVLFITFVLALIYMCSLVRFRRSQLIFANVYTREWCICMYVYVYATTRIMDSLHPCSRTRKNNENEKNVQVQTMRWLNNYR